jgi:hypothetical protein
MEPKVRFRFRFRLDFQQCHEGSACGTSRPADLAAFDPTDCLRVNRWAMPGHSLDFIAHQFGQIGLRPATSEPARPEIGVRGLTPRKLMPLFA